MSSLPSVLWVSVIKAQELRVSDDNARCMVCKMQISSTYLHKLHLCMYFPFKGVIPFLLFLILFKSISKLIESAYQKGSLLSKLEICPYALHYSPPSGRKHLFSTRYARIKVHYSIRAFRKKRAFSNGFRNDTLEFPSELLLYLLLGFY